MAEKRKPTFTMLLRKEGKKKSKKLELFDASLWSDYRPFGITRGAKRYRVRVNGKWIDTQQDKGKQFFTKWEIRDMLFRSKLFKSL